MAQNISVPDIGDFKDVEVIEVLVKSGDKINKNDPVVTIESDKSTVEIPSPESGQIKDLKVKIGDKVSKGSVIATIENEKIKSAPHEEQVVESNKDILSVEEQKTNGETSPVKNVKKVFAEPASKEDIDPLETGEWIESLNSVIENDVQIGNYVEVKNSKIASKCRINHHSFVGDAVLEMGVTLGAGTITCNHDGFKINTIKIGEGAYIGSGSNLVAPLNINARSTIASGSTITDDVNSGTLVIARSRQVTIEGWNGPKSQRTFKDTSKK